MGGGGERERNRKLMIDQIKRISSTLVQRREHTVLLNVTAKTIAQSNSDKSYLGIFS